MDIELYLPPFMEMDREKYSNRVGKLYINTIIKITGLNYPVDTLNNYLENIMFDRFVIGDYSLETWNKINNDYKKFTNKVFEKYDWEIEDEV